MVIQHSYTLFLQWLTLALLSLFGLYLAWDLGLIAILLQYDTSYVSSIILVVFLITSMVIGFRAMWLSREIDYALHIIALLHSRSSVLQLNASGQVVYDGLELPSSLLQSQIQKQLTRLAKGKSKQSDNPVSHLMLDNVEKAVVIPHELGWLIADITIKLGLLGTVIGFVIMLSAVAVGDNTDITTIQNMLIDMSSGMKIALYTTLSGLLSGMLLALQCHLIDRGANRLVILISDTVETGLSRS